jgi:hypothetical protein
MGSSEGLIGELQTPRCAISPLYRRGNEQLLGTFNAYKRLLGQTVRTGDYIAIAFAEIWFGSVDCIGLASVARYCAR